MHIEDIELILHENDLPSDFVWQESIAIDTETTGLNLHRDRVCLIQLYKPGDTQIHLVKMNMGSYDSTHLKKLLEDRKCLKIFHYARFDMAMLFRSFKLIPTPIFCSKIASKLVRTYTDKHGLKDLCHEFLDINLLKEQQSSDWAQQEISQKQLEYAAQDVLHLHVLREKLEKMLEREGRMALAQSCFDFLASRIILDLAGWENKDIFSHH